MENDIIIHRTLKFVYDYKLSPRECKIFSYAHNREFVTVYEVAKYMGLAIQNTSVVLKNMENKKVFRRVKDPSQNKFKYYVIVKI